MSTQSSSSPDPITKSARSLRLREAGFQDYSGIIALEAKFQLVSKSCEEWTHLWTNNPACSDADCKLPIGWVLEREDSVLCGYLGNIPLHCELEGRKLLAATTRSWVVDSAYRSHALLLLATYFKQPHVDLFLNTTVNAYAATAYQSLEGVPVPVGDWDRALFWITNHRGFAESFLQKKGAPLAKLLSFPLGTIGFLRDRLAASGFRGIRQESKVLPCSHFDDRFEQFWQMLKKKKSNLLLPVRTREALEWHFKFALLQNAAWIYTVEGDSGLSAYAIFLRQDNPQTGLTRVRLADFQSLDDAASPAVLNAMLRAAFDRCQQESIHMLELIGLSPTLEAAIEPARPHRRHLPNWMYYYKANERSLAEKLKDPAVWEPSLFDGDSSL
jgi:hypothetical protein